MKAINKFNELNQTISSNEITFHDNQTTSDSFIYVREKNQAHKILTKNIMYIKSFSDYVKIYNSGKKTTIRHTISALGTMLPEQNFIRIHRSFIIYINQISSFTNHSVLLTKQNYQ